MHCLTLYSGTIPNYPLVWKCTWLRAKKNNKTYLKQSRKITSTKMSWIRRDYSTFLKGNFNYLLKSNISFNISWLSTSICLFIRPIRTKSCFLNQAPELDVALLCFCYHHHFKFLVCVKKYCGAPHVKMSQCQGCTAKCLVQPISPQNLTSPRVHWTPLLSHWLGLNQ